MIASGANVVSVHELIGSLDSQPIRYELVLRFHLVGEQISSIAEYTNDQYLAEDLFTEPAPPASIPPAQVAAAEV